MKSVTMKLVLYIPELLVIFIVSFCVGLFYIHLNLVPAKLFLKM